MSEPQEARRLLDAADDAALAGDLASAYGLLSGAAAVQEATLGPGHPALAGTLNNLAVVAERTGRIGHAESLYRRAAAIASAALPADHPMVVESLNNLVTFCRTQHRPLHAPTGSESSDDEALSWLNVFPREAEMTPAEARDRLAPADDPAPRPAATGSWHNWPIAVLVGLLVGSLGLVRVGPSASPGEWLTTPASRLAGPEAVLEARALAAPTPTPPGPSQADHGGATSEDTVRAQVENITAALSPAAHTSRPSLTDARLCSELTTVSEPWQCQALGDVIDARRIVLFTRVRTALPTNVDHRWYRGDTLVQAVALHVGASGLEGYRTYSQLTVTAGTWTVEARAKDGALLYERTFDVQ